MKSDPIDVPVYKHRETNMSVLVSKYGAESNAVWIPKSQCEIDRVEDFRLWRWTLTLPEWLAEDNGLI